MNKINFNQTGGFPLSTNILDAMQSAYAIFNQLGNLAGNKAIISGCEQLGNTVADGVIFLNGEILPFKGGAIGSSVIIKEESESRVFEDGATKPVIFKKYVTFGTSTPEKTFTWAEFKRVDNLLDLTEKKAEKIELDKSIKRIEKLEEQKPMIGEIKQGIFDLENLPPGWFHCNGQNGTPDLRGYFLRGKTDERALGSFQEDAQQKITGRFSSFNREWWGGSPNGAFAVEGFYSTRVKSGADDEWGFNYNFDSSRQVRTAEENRPKNYAVQFIMYLGKKTKNDGNR